jgi:hypothetical protein
MVPAILHRVIFRKTSPPPHLASLLTIQPAVLTRYIRRKVTGCDYPGIVPSEHHYVRGTFVTGLTDAHVRDLDRFEGGQYRRVKVDVLVFEDGALSELRDEEKAVAEIRTYLQSRKDEKVEWVTAVEGVDVGEAKGHVGEEEEETEGEGIRVVRRAETYVYRYESSLEKDEWSFEKFKEKHLKYWVGSTEEYEFGSDEEMAESDDEDGDEVEAPEGEAMSYGDDKSQSQQHSDGVKAAKPEKDEVKRLD